MKRLERDLTPYRELVSELQEATGLSAEDLAVALAVDVNRGKPFLLDTRHELRGFGNERAERPTRDRAPRERAPREKRDARPARDNSAKREKVLGSQEEGFERFRVEVGHLHGVKPGNLVGAIANEAGLDSQSIGRIELFDSFSVVDLPDGMPKDLFKHLKGVWVCGQKLQISRFEGNLTEGKVIPRAPKPTAERKPHPRSDSHAPHRPVGGFGGGDRFERRPDSRSDVGGGETRQPQRRDEGGERPAFRAKSAGGKPPHVAAAKSKPKKVKVRAAAAKNKGKPKRKAKETAS